MNDRLKWLSARVGEALLSHGLVLSTAESCTGGWVGAAITDIPGSSEWFDCGFVTYSNQSKQRLLGVSEQTLATCGAVSEATVREMAAGALARSGADMALAVSGIAGPGGGSPHKPVGHVWIAWARRDGVTMARAFHFDGGRTTVRRRAVEAALSGVLEQLGA
jgi:nicotinamide-nucleotide amidase